MCGAICACRKKAIDIRLETWARLAQGRVCQLQNRTRAAARSSPTYQRREEMRSVALQPRIVSDDLDWMIEAAVRGAGIVRLIDLKTRPFLEQGLLDPEALEATTNACDVRLRCPRRSPIYLNDNPCATKRAAQA